MKRIFGLLLLTIFAFENHANTIPSGNGSGPSVEIAPAVKNNYLDIEVDEELAGASFTVSVFSNLGEIVYEGQLGLGLNKIDVTKLAAGEYTAVVRKNGEYTSKQTFVVS